jgi:drug/metabolite transporter (DMT)-like permease
MTTPITETPVRGRWRSAVALVTGLLVGVILSLGTDQILHVLKIYPPWGQTMSDGLFMVATAYRVVYTILGSYIAARLAPYRPRWHAMVLGVIGLIVSIAGAVATWNTQPPIGPHWYALLIAAISIPCAWLGGMIRERQLGITERPDYISAP